MIADLRPYAEYKQSGQSWFGDVPRHWSVLPNRALFVEVKDRGHPDADMLSVTITRGIVKQKDLLEGSSKKDSSNRDKSAYKLVQPRDIAYNKMRAWQGAIGASAQRGIISPAYVVMRLRNTDDLPYYYHHLYRTPLFAKEAERWSYGITSDMWSLRPEHFKMIYTPLPPPPEQAAIVRFLDWANGRLERAIRAKWKMIALLNEQKQAIIHRAVTRGLDPDVKLKDSGIPWLGEIPEHWEVLRAKFLAHIKTGGRDTVDRIDGGQYPFFVRSQIVEQIDTYSFDGEAVLTAGDGAGVAKVFHYIDGKFDYHQRVYKFSNFRRVAGRFFFLYMKSMLKFEALDASAKSTVDSLRLPLLQNFPIVVPSREEQLAIVRAVETETHGIDTAISRFEREIELLREYRTRLVADVVTGKLDVREAASQLPDEAPLEPDADNDESLEDIVSEGIVE